MTQTTKFFKFNQNNSGGYFDVDENVCHMVIIEAKDANHAVGILEPMIESQSSSCACCGERWSTFDPDEIELSATHKTIEDYAQFFADKCGWTIPDIRIHFLDGTKKEIYSAKVLN